MSTLENTGIKMNLNLIALLIVYLIVSLVLLVADQFFGQVAFRRSERIMDTCLYSFSQQIPILVASSVGLILTNRLGDLMLIGSGQIVLTAATFWLYTKVQSILTHQRGMTRGHVRNKLEEMLSSGDKRDLCKFEKLAESMIDVDFLRSAASLDYKQEKREIFLDCLPETLFKKAGVTADEFLVPDSWEKKASARMYVLLGLLSLVPFVLNLLLGYLAITSAT